MTTSAPLTDTELAVIRHLRTVATADCARTRMRADRRELIRDALVSAAQGTRRNHTDATVVPLPRQRTRQLADVPA